MKKRKSAIELSPRQYDEPNSTTSSVVGKEAIFPERLCSNTENVRKLIGQDFDQMSKDPETMRIRNECWERSKELDRMLLAPVNTLTAAQLLELIIAKQLTYTKTPKHFERWWASLPPKIQHEVDAATEEFTDLNDYEKERFRDGGPLLGSPLLAPEALYNDFRKDLPPSFDDFQGMKVFAINRDELNSKALNRLIEKQVMNFRAFLRMYFTNSQRRGTVAGNKLRNIEWSKRLYLGEKAEADAADSEPRVTASALKKAVTRHRNARLLQQWVMRAKIVHYNFPPIREISAKKLASARNTS